MNLHQLATLDRLYERINTLTAERDTARAEVAALRRANTGCPLHQCDHPRMFHDGDGDDEALICTVDRCSCRGFTTPQTVH